MENIIYLKEGGLVKKIILDNRFKFPRADAKASSGKCIEDLFKRAIDMGIDSDKNKEISKMISSMLKDSHNAFGNDIIDLYFNKLKTANSMDDLVKVGDLFNSIYLQSLKKINNSDLKDEKNKNKNSDLLKEKKYFSSKFKKMLDKDSDIVMINFIKKIVFLALKKDIVMINKNDKINCLVHDLVTDNSVDSMDCILRFIGKDDLKFYNNGIYELSKSYFSDIMYNIIKTYKNRACHLCWNNCKYANARDCDKIKDKVKKVIDNYPFINDGIQVVSKDKVITFLVMNCNDYLMVENNKMTFEEKMRVKKAKESLRLFVYDAMDMEEAERKREEFRRKDFKGLKRKKTL